MDEAEQSQNDLDKFYGGRNFAKTGNKVRVYMFEKIAPITLVLILITTCYTQAVAQSTEKLDLRPGNWKLESALITETDAKKNSNHICLKSNDGDRVLPAAELGSKMLSGGKCKPVQTQYKNGSVDFVLVCDGETMHNTSVSMNFSPVKMDITRMFKIRDEDDNIQNASYILVANWVSEVCN